MKCKGTYRIDERNNGHSVEEFWKNLKYLKRLLKRKPRGEDRTYREIYAGKNVVVYVQRVKRVYDGIEEFSAEDVEESQRKNFVLRHIPANLEKEVFFW